jgi:glycyl-tRNA synthetase beta chain
MVCLFGRRVIPFEIQVGNHKVKASNKSQGHRFLAPKGEKPGAPFVVESFRGLVAGLKKHYVVLDPQKRRLRLEKEIQKLEKKARAKRAFNLRGLSVEFLSDLVEWPGAVLGGYPKEFSSLPDDVLHTVLIRHQKYIPLKRKTAFIAVTNMPSDPNGYMRKGSERVVVARLRDAKFFWVEDLKRPLASRSDALQGVSFHEKLGNYQLKTERVVVLSRWLAEQCRVPVGSVESAAELSKCDLTTGMVGEFPELQGIMGGLYAKEQGEPDEIWQAVYSHYRPTGAGDAEDFPLNREGAIVSLADKLDSLVGMFSVGVVPTGSRDPFGLRRAALGVLRILLESEERLDFRVVPTPRELLDRAFELIGEQLGAIADRDASDALHEFFVERLRFLFKRFRYDEVNAVFALGAMRFAPVELARRLDAVASLRGSADFEALSIAFKRVRNILADHETGNVEVEAFTEDAERELWSAFQKIEPEATKHLSRGHYSDALRELSRLRPQVDVFFDKVLVMAPDPKLRGNRLALLDALQSQFTRVADLSEIVTGPKEGALQSVED